jgi:hypothetical protein
MHLRSLERAAGAGRASQNADTEPPIPVRAELHLVESILRPAVVLVEDVHEHVAARTDAL